MGKVKYTIESDNIALTDINVIRAGLFQAKQDQEQVYYRITVKGDLTLDGAGYALLFGLVDACEVVQIKCLRSCEGVYTDYWIGYFTKFDCTFDEGRCTVSVKPKTDDKYKCIIETWEKVRNVFGVAISNVPILGTYQTVVCPSLPCAAIMDGTWCLDEFTGGAYWYHRIVANGTCSGATPVPPDTFYTWTQVPGSSCPTPQFYRCPDLAGDDKISPYKYGRRMDDVLQYLLDQTDCGLTVVSSFFGIGTPEGSPPSNIAYIYATKWLKNLTIHQKSDVKRPNASENSTAPAWDMKLKDLLDDLRLMFNVYFVIDGTDLILEHISYFEQTEGLDLSGLNIKKRYSYNQEAPKTEKWQYLDNFSSSLFASPTLTYECGNNDVEYRLKLFSTDIGVIDDPLYADVIGDAGFVLISNKPGTGGNYIINELNFPLSFPDLLENLHRHNRPFDTYATAPASTVTALSVKKIRKLDMVTTSHCCTDPAFNPDEMIVTSIGDAVVESVDVDLVRDTLQLSLMI
jgi:hypothetical protein